MEALFVPAARWQSRRGEEAHRVHAFSHGCLALSICELKRSELKLMDVEMRHNVP